MSSSISRKRTLGEEQIDNSDSLLPSSSLGPALKKRRLLPAAPKRRVAAKVAEADDRPEPRGQPEVWAESRQALCESLPYYQAYQSSAYTWGSSQGFDGYAYGFLLDNDNDDHGYMSEKVVVTRLGGGMKADKESGKMEQSIDHSKFSKNIAPYLNNQRERVPIMLIVGAKNGHCPVKVPHRYNVLGAFHITDIWSEKIKGKVVCRARFEMIDLTTPSWWGIKGAPLPPAIPDETTKALCMTCTSCGTSSKQVSSAGWMCLDETCENFSAVNGNIHQGPSALNPAFMNERNKWRVYIKVPMPVKPGLPAAPSDGNLTETSLQAWKGMVCRTCGRCNSRTKWDEWKCETDGCTFEIPISYTIVPRSQLAPDHAFEAEGHAIPFDKWEAPVVRTKSAFLGYWRKATYELSPGNYVTHYMANQVINRQPGGADEALEQLQGAQLGMQRFKLESSPVEGDMITKHFGMNFGLPYKYVVAVDSRPFSEAPPAIIDALNRVTWAGRDAVKDGSFKAFNELLSLAYMEKQAIGWHDDGEDDLGLDVVSQSLGGAATMTFRMKSKHWHFKDKVFDKKFLSDKYNPTAFVRPGSQAWEMRTAVNELYRAGRMEDYEQAKEELGKALAKDKHQNAPTTLSLELRHGDLVAMHGAELHKIHEHAVTPKGKLRYGLTGRYIKPENIPVKEHWKGNFTIPPEKVYDGDLALYKAHFPDEEDEQDN